ncbi:hypothetical protein Taro_012122 [Colocasia esculenta]|uniref:Homeobox-leucine zipper protein n=1 Tax=Colocasia esculenta TaxID=4460 RepID=A0A843UEQ3_COLES|nr:hypothetical protein [Colocasia esculenta]
MKRLSSGSSESLVRAAGDEGLIGPPAPEEEKGEFGGDFTSIVDGTNEDDDDCVDEELCSPRGAGGGRGSGACAGGAGSEKKRRLSTEQVKALERNFEVENKLEPERKVRLAQDLGLQPRQVAVWFQNRRARWKTKQLERDYALLKSNYDTLQLSLDTLRAEHQTLLIEMKELRSKLADVEGHRAGSTPAVKEEPAASESDIKVACSEAEEEVVEPEAEAEVDEEMLLPALIYKDGSSADSSDSSAVLNAGEDNTSPAHHPHHRDAGALFPAESQQQFPGPPPQHVAAFDFGSSKCYPNTLPFYHYTHQQTQQHHQHHPPQDQQISFSSSPPSPPLMVRMVEEHNFLLGDDPCSGSFFSDEQLPNLPWYCSDQWS